MAYRPLTYAGQYPPLHPRSPSDVSSYALLHTSLRALPELSKEGDKILNEEMLARFVEGVKGFQTEHLGRKSKSKYWPTIRLPAPLFADRSSYPNGPLSVAILAAFRVKRSAPWRNFNFDNPKLFDDNIGIIKKIEGDLVDRGFLKRPVVYFDASVEEGLGRNELQRLAKIAVRFGAKVVDDPAEVANGKVSHIVAYDPEEHDSREVMEEEDRREREGEEAEKTYLKTLAVVDFPVDEAAPSNSGGPTRKMALVHWWYHPSSYDEWMAAEDVAGDIEADDHPGIPGGPAVVGCKFVRDVERFNEWGVEADYAVMEYERKLAYLRKEPAKSAASTKKSGKRRSERGAAKAESALEQLDADPNAEGSPSAKRIKLGSDGLPDAPPSPRRQRSVSKSSSPTSKAPLAAAHRQPTRPTSDRRKPAGRLGTMAPRRIPTGFRGPRGEVDRRTVYDGALRVESEAYSVVRDALEDYLLGNDVVEGKVPPPALGARPEWRKLLPPTGFVRPSADATLECVTVTELTLKEVEATVPPAEGQMGGTTVQRTATVAVNVRVPVVKAGEEAVVAGGEAPVSIRGGGEGDAAPPGQAAAVVTEAPSNAPPAQPEGVGGGATTVEEPPAAVDPTIAVAADATAPPAKAEGAVQASVPAANQDAAAAQPSAAEGSGDAPNAVAVTGEVAATSEAVDVDANLPSASEGQSGAPNVTAGDAGAAEATPTLAGVGETAEKTTIEDAIVADPGAPTQTGSNDDATQPMDVDPSPVAEKLSEEPQSLAPVEEKIESKPEGGSEQQPEQVVASVAQGEGAAPATGASLSHDAQPKATEPSAGGGGQGVNSRRTPTPVFEFAPLPTPPPFEPAPPPASPEFELLAREATVPGASAPPTVPGLAPQNITDVTKAAGEQKSEAGNVEKASETPVAAPTDAQVPAPPAPASVVDVEEAPAEAQVQASAVPASTPAATTNVALNVEEVANKPAPEPTTASAEAQQTTATTLSSTPAQAAVEQSSEQLGKAPVPSSSGKQLAACQVVSLPPGTQLSTSLYRPSVAAPTAEETKSANVARASWYDPSMPSDFEKRTLPEWFNGTAPHRTPASYIETREKILDIAKRNGGQYITATAIRRSVLGDAGSLLRLHQFLIGQGLLNSDRVGETAPIDAVLRGKGAARKPKRMRLQGEWTTSRMQALEASVIRHVAKKKQEEGVVPPGQGTPMVVDWSAVAADMGGDVSAAECQRAFIEPPSEDARLVADASNGNVKSMLSRVLEGVRPEVLEATVNAALRSTEDVTEAKKACFVALTAKAAAEEGARAEAEVENTLMDIVDQQVQRLENRVALLDDVEALLEAERVSLELERRDMYTTRCRHWFGDGSS